MVIYCCNFIQIQYYIIVQLTPRKIKMYSHCAYPSYALLDFVCMMKNIHTHHIYRQHHLWIDLNGSLYVISGFFHMGQKDQEGKHIRYMLLFFLKDKAGVGWEMKISKFCQLVPFTIEFLMFSFKFFYFF